MTRARDLASENPDILDYAQLTGCRLDVDEDRCELKRQDKDGKQPSGNAAGAARARSVRPVDLPGMRRGKHRQILRVLRSAATLKNI